MSNLIDFFDKLKFWGGHRNSILQAIRFYGCWNVAISTIANISLPIYFKLTANSPKNKLKHTNKTNTIVSLTSFGPRLEKIWLVIESLLRQEVKPDRIILYLTASQVHDIELLPKSLLDLRKRGLEIVLCPDNIRSHTKYYYAMTQNPDSIIITVDDDLFYRSDLVKKLLESHQEYPNNICANWVKEIIPSTDKYAEWPDGNIRSSKYNYLLLGVSGVLYPPHSLHGDAFNIENIINLCLTADDVWLSCMAIKNRTPILYTGYKYNFLPVHIPNNETLISVNRQRNQTQVDNLNKYYLEKTGKKPFIDFFNTIYAQ